MHKSFYFIFIFFCRWGFSLQKKMVASFPAPLLPIQTINGSLPPNLLRGSSWTFSAKHCYTKKKKTCFSFLPSPPFLNCGCEKDKFLQLFKKKKKKNLIIVNISHHFGINVPLLSQDFIFIFFPMHLFSIVKLASVLMAEPLQFLYSFVLF